MFYAYVHARPGSVSADGIFYVGKGRGLRSHNLKARNPHHGNIVKKYGNENILIGKLDCSSEDIAFDLEKGLIKCLRRMGVELTNQTEGGEGVAGFRMSSESRQLISLQKLGKPSHMLGKTHSNETKVKISKAAKNISDETRQKMSLSHKGKKLPPEVCAKMSRSHTGKEIPVLKGRPSAMLGKHHTTETKAKISLKLRGKPMLPQVKAALLKANINPSEVTKEKRASKIRGRPSKLKGVRQSAEFIAKRTATFSLLKWINNGIVNRRVNKFSIGEYLSNGWSLGRKVTK